MNSGGLRAKNVCFRDAYAAGVDGPCSVFALVLRACVCTLKCVIRQMARLKSLNSFLQDFLESAIVS